MVFERVANIHEKFENNHCKCYAHNSFFEILAEYRDLSIPEWNFHRILEGYLLELLERQRVYWRQRGNVKWVQLGDAGTHFFHANATLRHRGKLVNELTSKDEVTVTQHGEKEKLSWEEFKERMGVSEFTGFTISPSCLIQSNENLQHLEEPFSHEKIDSVIKALPNNKSPGPDGFNNEFMKASWPVIKQDFYDLCSSFFNNNCCLQSINSSYITLVPKVDNAKYVNDYRPNSLLNSSVKLITWLKGFSLQSSH